MSTISFSGLGSGMDYSSWVDALVQVKEQESVTPIEEKITKTEKSQSAVSTIKSSFSTLSSTLSTFTDSNILSSYDIFSRKTVSTSDYEKTASAIVTNAASVQNFELRVTQLATPTKATGMNNLGQIADMSTLLKHLNNGVVETTNDNDIADVSIYVNNKKYTFEVTDETTLQDFADFLEEKTGGTVNYTDGILSVDLPDDVTDVKLGSTADGGNLLDFMGFKTERDEDGNLTGFTSNKTLTKIDTTKPIMSTANLSQPITAGTFTIGNVGFTIDETTSISGLISQINSNSDTGVTASYDAITNRLILTAKEAVDTTINIENVMSSNTKEIISDVKKEYADVTSSYDKTTNINTFTGSAEELNNLKTYLDENTHGTATIDGNGNLIFEPEDKPSNFTDVVGWTTSINGENELALGSQVIGKNALFEINGEEFEAASNTVGEDVTGITGLTLNLKKVTTDDETATITINNDLTEVEQTIDTFVSQYNSLVSKLKEVTGSSGYLAYDSSLRKMVTDMANLLMDAVPGLSKYNCFSNVGIGTGEARANISDTSNTITFDKSKFEAAMADNQAEVKKLFINDDAENALNNGVMKKMETLIDTYMDDESGYFTIKEKSYEDQIDSLNETLTRRQALLASYKERLTTQFTNMDTYISKMQSYSSYISSISSSS